MICYLFIKYDAYILVRSGFRGSGSFNFGLRILDFGLKVSGFRFRHAGLDPASRSPTLCNHDGFRVRHPGLDPGPE